MALGNARDAAIQRSDRLKQLRRRDRFDRLSGPSNRWLLVIPP